MFDYRLVFDFPSAITDSPEVLQFLEVNSTLVIA